MNLTQLQSHVEKMAALRRDFLAQWPTQWEDLRQFGANPERETEMQIKAWNLFRQHGVIPSHPDP